MADFVKVPETDWRNILDATRAKTGSTEKMVSGVVSGAIAGIGTGGGSSEWEEQFIRAIGGDSENPVTKLPDGLTQIRPYAFYEASVAIKSIPAGVTDIGQLAFYWCDGLTEITFKGTPSYIDYEAFHVCDNLLTINVPWAEGEVANAPWSATNATINYNYTGG